jgi:hypothetical protein
MMISPMRLAFFDAAGALSLAAALAPLTNMPTHVIRLDTQLTAPDELPTATLLRFEEVLSPADLLAIERDATWLAGRWFCRDGRDLTLYHGVSLGLTVDYEIKVWLSQVLKVIRLLDKLEPAEVVFVDEGSWAATVLRTWCTVHKRASTVTKAGSLPSPRPIQTAGPARPPWRQRMLIWMLNRGRSPETAERVHDRASRILALWYPTMKGHFRQIIATDGPAITFMWPVYDRRLLIDGRAHWTASLGSLLTGCRDGSVCEAAASSRLAADLLQSSDWTEHGMQLGPLLWECFGPILAERWHHSGHLARRLDRLITRLEPSAVIVGQDATGPARVLVQVARSHRVPSLVATHGLLANPPGVYPPPLADAVIAWGPAQQGFLVQEGIPADLVCCAGNSGPSMTSPRFPKLGRWRARRRLSPDRHRLPLLLVAAAPGGLSLALSTPSDQNRFLAQLCEALAPLDWLRVVVRFHPSTDSYESLATKKTVVANYGRGRLHIDPGMRLRDALLAADVVMANESTVALEALKIGRPLVEAAVLSRPLTYRFSDHKVAIGVTDLQLLPGAICAALTEHRERRQAWQQRVDRFLADQLGPQPWTAQPILRMIEHLAGQPSGQDAAPPAGAPL